MHTSYTAVELSQQGPVLTVQQLPKVLEHNTIVIRPSIMGICRSDLKEVLGIRSTRHDFGHEVVGMVEWAGVSTPFSHGDLVCLNPHIQISRTSGFAELMIAQGSSSALRQAFIKTPKEIPLKRLVFCEPMACAQHCVTKLLQYLGYSRLDGLDVAIVGAGCAGTLIGLLAKHLGATVMLFNRSTDRLEFLKSTHLFSTDVLLPFNTDIIDQFDVVIAATSFLFSNVLKFSMQIIRPHGLLLLFGGTHEDDVLADTNLNIDMLRRKEALKTIAYQSKALWIGGTYGSLFDDFLNVIRILSQDTVSSQILVERLITEEFLLDDLPQKLNVLSKVNYHGKKIVRVNLM